MLYSAARHSPMRIALDLRISRLLDRQRRTPCFPQIDLTLRAILHEKQPPFIVLFSHQTMSYSQILFSHPLFVPAQGVYYDFPSGCPNPGCNDNCCELIRFPKRGAEVAAILSRKRRTRYQYGRRVKPKEMCNWIDCSVCFDEDAAQRSDSSEISSEGSVDDMAPKFAGLVCSRCKLVKYCSPAHQKSDWDEHRRVCASPSTE